MAPQYGTLDGPGLRGAMRKRPPTLALVAGTIALGVLACVALLAAVAPGAGSAAAHALAQRGGRSLTSALASELAAPGGSRGLLRHEKTLLALKPQVAAAESAVQQAVDAGASDDKVKELEAKAAAAKKKLAEAQAEAQSAEAALVTAAGGAEAQAKAQAQAVPSGQVSPEQAGLARGGKASRQQKGFISGDRFGEHHVYSDFGIHHKRRRGNWMQRHFGDWINTADGRPQYVCDYYDDPYETGTHRRVDVIDNEWCDDEYYGYHYPVHYLDDRGVYNNGYGEHLGTAYGDNGVKPGVLHKMVQDHYGDFFHGLSPGYDWVEEHNRRSEVPAITQYAYSTFKDKTYGDEGDKRQRPLYYMDWDEDGTRALDHTKTFGEEDFMSQGGDFAVKPKGAQHLKKQQLLLKKEQSEAHTLEQQVKKEKLDLEVKKLESQVASAKKSIHATIEKTMAKESHQQAQESKEQAATHRRRAARKAMLQRRHLTKGAQTRVAKGHVQELSSVAAAADPAREAADMLDAEVGDVEASLGVARKPAVALQPRVVRVGKPLSLRQERRLAYERRMAAEEREAEQARARRAWLQRQLAHGSGSYALRAVEAAKHRTQMQQALSLRQDRNGELAQENMGRPHGCYIQQVTGATAMLDDCDPLQEKMLPAIEAESQRLAEATASNLGGVHWTSGDVPYNYDVFPMREAHGGYSGLSDIAFPADAVYPTVYKPTLGLGPGDYAHATGTKAPSSAGAALKTAPGAFGDKEVVDKAAVLATEAKDKELKSTEAGVEKALAEEHREEAVAATDKAVADKVLADAMKNQDEEQRTRLLKAATAEYEKSARASAAAKAAAPKTGADASGAAAAAGTGGAGGGKPVKASSKGGVEISLPKEMAKGSVTISFSPTGDGKVEAPAAPSSEDALEAAHKLVMTEEKLREQAKHLAAVEKAKTEAIVERNKELNKELAHIVPDISTSAATQKKVAAQ